MGRLNWALAFVALFCAFSSPAFALNASLVSPSGTPLALQYDTESQSYADTGVNPDALIRFCNEGGLESFYTGLVYKVGDSYKLVSTPLGGGFGDLIYFPGTVSTCGDANIQISSFRAYYPSWPVAVISGDSSLSSDDTFLPLSNTTGWMSGTYLVTRNVSGTNVTIGVYEARTGTGAGIAVDKNYLVVGIRNSTGDILDSGITSINDSITLDRGSSTETPEVVVNGIGTAPTVTPTPTPRRPPDEPVCVSDYQCPDDYYCIYGACAPVQCPCGVVRDHACSPYSCCNNSDCGTGMRCTDHLCVQATPTPIPGACVRDSDCPNGYLCVGGICRQMPPQCDSDSDCLPGFACQGGKCVEVPPECEGDSDCAQGEVCVNGQCVTVPPECVGDLDCPAGYVCEAGTCKAVPPECTADADCPIGKYCINGQCRPALRLSAPSTAEINTQLKVNATYSDGTPASGATVEMTLPSGRKYIATADMDGIASFYPDETGTARFLARRNGDLARAQTSILPMAFFGTIAGIRIDCSNAWLYILLIAGLCSLLAWWLIRSRLEGEKKFMSEEQLKPFTNRERIYLWGSWLLVSAMLFLLPLFASLFIEPCVLVQYMPIEVILIIMMELAFLAYDKLREKDRLSGAAGQKPSPSKKQAAEPELDYKSPDDQDKLDYTEKGEK